MTALSLTLLVANAQSPRFPDDCWKRIRPLRDWRPAAAGSAADSGAAGKGTAVTAIGDFDGDGRPDLVALGTSDGRQVLAVCRSNGAEREAVRRIALHRVGLLRGSCHDTVYKVDAGSSVRNPYGREVALQTDAFATSCLATKERRIFIFDPDQRRFDSFPY